MRIPAVFAGSCQRRAGAAPPSSVQNHDPERTTTSPLDREDGRSLVLHDPTCETCCGFVRFVRHHDSTGLFEHDHLDSERARRYRCRDRSSLHLIENRGRSSPRVFVRSKAILRILDALDGDAPTGLARLLRDHPRRRKFFLFLANAWASPRARPGTKVPFPSPRLLDDKTLAHSPYPLLWHGRGRGHDAGCLGPEPL